MGVLMWDYMHIHSCFPSSFCSLDDAWLSQWNTGRHFWPTLVYGQPLEEPETNLSSSDSVDLTSIWNLLADSWFFRSLHHPAFCSLDGLIRLRRLRTNPGLNRIKWGQQSGFAMKPLKHRRYKVQIFLFRRQHMPICHPHLPAKLRLCKPLGVKHSSFLCSKKLLFGYKDCAFFGRLLLLFGWTVMWHEACCGWTHP